MLNYLWDTLCFVWGLVCHIFFLYFCSRIYFPFYSFSASFRLLRVTYYETFVSLSVGCSVLWGHLFFWPKSQPLTYPLSRPWASRMSFFFSVPSLPIILIPEAILDPVSNLEGFFISSGFSLVPPALQLALLFFYSWKLSFHAGDSHSGSKSSSLFPGFPEVAAVPSSSSEI